MEDDKREGSSSPPLYRQHHRLHEPYSEHNPVPTTNPLSKERLLNRKGKGKDTSKEVYDPIAHEHVRVRDATHEDLNDAFGGEEVVTPPEGRTENKGSGSKSPLKAWRNRRDADTASPKTPSTPAEPPGTPQQHIGLPPKQNALFYPLPPINWKQHHDKSRGIIQRYITIAAIVGFLASSLHPRIGPLLAAIFTALGGIYAMRMVDSSFEDSQADTEKQRGEEAARDRIPESTEWLNSLITQIWPLINSELFTSINDQLEDIMQASVPGMIESVKIVELEQGETPMRVLSIRSLPSDGMEDIMRERGRLGEEDQTGRFVIAFAYRPKPSGASLKSKLKNARLLIEFFLGAKKLSAVKFPVFVELKGMVGTVRARIQLTPEPPFARDLTVSLMGLPRVEISAVPLWQRLPNVMGLPLISTFVESSIETAMREYCAPRSLSMDIAEIMVGDGLKKSTDAFGILLVEIHRAQGLAKSDARGSSDPYVVLQFSRLARPLFSTRIIIDDLNPYFEETAVILVTDDAVKADESLSAQLWDSDRFSPDDELGEVEVPLSDLIRNKGQKQERCDKLAPLKAGQEGVGTLAWSVTFYGLRDLKKDVHRATNGADPRVAEDLKKSEPALKESSEPQPSSVMPAHPTTYIPPDPNYPSGILSVSVLQIADLGFRTSKGKYGKRTGITVGQEKETSQETNEDSDDSPSSYVLIHLNDTPIYRTRYVEIAPSLPERIDVVRTVKPLSNQPYFNAGTERYIPDWRNSMLMFGVRSKNVREADALLGVLPIRVADALKNASFVTQWYPISGGIGYGRIRIGLLFRSVDVQLPRSLLAYDVGTLRILSDVKVYDFDSSGTRKELDGAKLQLQTLGTKWTTRACREENDGLAWSVEVPQPPLRMPLKRRDASSLLIEFHTSRSPLKSKPFAVAREWIRVLESDSEHTLKLPLYTTSNYDGFVQNHIDDEHSQHLDLVRVGTVEVKVMFKSGLGDAHRRSALMKRPEEAMLMEAWDAAINAGLRIRSVDGKTPRVATSNGIEDRQPGEESSSSDEDEHDPEDAGAKRRHERSVSDFSIRSEESETTGQVGDGAEGARAKAQQRTHQRGLYNSKTVRSLSWIKSGAKERASKLRHSFDMKARAPDPIESEV